MEPSQNRHGESGYTPLPDYEKEEPYPEYEPDGKRLLDPEDPTQEEVLAILTYLQSRKEFRKALLAHHDEMDLVFRESLFFEPFVSGGLPGRILIWVWMLVMVGVSLAWLIGVKGYVNQLTQYGWYLQTVASVLIAVGLLPKCQDVQRAVDLWILPTADGVAKVVFAGDFLLMINTNSAYLARLSSSLGIEQGYVDALNSLVHFMIPSITIFLYAALRGDACSGAHMGLCMAQRVFRIVLPMIPIFFYAGYFSIAEVYETNSMGNVFLLIGNVAVCFVNGMLVYW